MTPSRRRAWAIRREAHFEFKASRIIGRTDPTPGLNSEQLSAYFTLMEVSRLLRYAVDGHVDRVRQLLFEPMTGKDLAALSTVLGRVRDHMRATPPRSAKPRAGRGRTD